jgi:hypothetical protein
MQLWLQGHMIYLFFTSSSNLVVGDGLFNKDVNSALGLLMSKVLTLVQ